jgi:NDP-sugar pyrophosphorylase family protein
MLRVEGRPVIDFLMERLAKGGCTEIRVVTRPEKEDLARHIGTSGATVIFARPVSVADSIRAGLEGLSDEDVVQSGFPDTIWDPLDGFVQVSGRLRKPVEVALGLFRVPPQHECDRVQLDESGAVHAVHVRPRNPRSDLTWGCFAARARALRSLSEAEPGAYFERLRREGRLAGVYLSDRYFDIGTPDSLLRARQDLRVDAPLFPDQEDRPVG